MSEVSPDAHEYTATTDEIRQVIAWRYWFAKDNLTPAAFDLWLVAERARVEAETVEKIARYLKRTGSPTAAADVLAEFGVVSS